MLLPESLRGVGSSWCVRQKAASGLWSHTGHPVFYILRQTAVAHVNGKATADVFWHGVMLMYHGAMSLFHVENEAMSRGTRVMLLILSSKNGRISEPERFLGQLSTSIHHIPEIHLNVQLPFYWVQSTPLWRGKLKYYNMCIIRRISIMRYFWGKSTME